MYLTKLLQIMKIELAASHSYSNSPLTEANYFLIAQLHIRM